MPYIKRKYRKIVEDSFNQLNCDIQNVISAMIDDCSGYEAAKAKALAYVIFKLIRKNYVRENVSSWYGKEDGSKVLRSVDSEFRRRFIHPHEDRAKFLNGDVE